MAFVEEGKNDRTADTYSALILSLRIANMYHIEHRATIPAVTAV